jgi:hypothetical protein
MANKTKFLRGVEIAMANQIYGFAVSIMRIGLRRGVGLYPGFQL